MAGVGIAASGHIGRSDATAGLLPRRRSPMRPFRGVYISYLLEAVPGCTPRRAKMGAVVVAVGWVRTCAGGAPWPRRDGAYLEPNRDRAMGDGASGVPAISMASRMYSSAGRCVSIGRCFVLRGDRWPTTPRPPEPCIAPPPSAWRSLIRYGGSAFARR